MDWSGEPCWVQWRDAHHALNEGDLPDGDFLNVTVGWVKAGPKWTKVACERTGSGERRGVTRIPTVLIVRSVQLSAVQEGPA